MSKRLVIFGSGQIAELAQFYFKAHTEYDIAAFTVDRSFIDAKTRFGLPLMPFEDLCKTHPPDDFDLFVAVSYAKLNELRKQKYLAAKDLGYRLPSYVSPHASVLNEGRIGENCLILEDNTIQPFAVIGNNVTLWSGNHIGHHARIGDHCFLASHIVVSGGVAIGESCFIGVNATLRDNIKIGEKCVIGAGSLLTADAEPGGVYSIPAAERSRVPSSRLRQI